MGSDNLFRKGRERKARELERRQADLQRQPRILIVCEDSKSAAYYFQDMAKDLGLKAVEVRGKECGSAPVSVVEYAVQTYLEDKRGDDPYDRVYCVFDRDQHADFADAVQRIQSKGEPFFAITSTPCFEVWLLLHYNCVSRPYAKAGRRSPCDQAISDLKNEKEWRKYGKGTRNIYAGLAGDKTKTAIANAKRLLKANQANGSDNPETHVHELVDFLIECAKKRRIDDSER